MDNFCLQRHQTGQLWNSISEVKKVTMLVWHGYFCLYVYSNLSFILLQKKTKTKTKPHDIYLLLSMIQRFRCWSIIMSIKSEVHMDGLRYFVVCLQYFEFYFTKKKQQNWNLTYIELTLSTSHCFCHRSCLAFLHPLNFVVE